MQKHKLTMRIFSIICLTLLISSRYLCAADQFLDTCLKIAEARDKKLAVAAEQISLSRVRVARSGRAFFPVIYAQRHIERGTTAINDTAEGDIMTKQSYQADQFGLRAVQPVFEGGRAAASYRYDDLMLDSARYNYTKTKEELFYRVKLAYYEMLALRMEYTALDKAFTDITKLMNKVKIEYNAKAIAELDLLEAQNFRDKVENLLRDSEANLTLAHKKLVTLINVNSLDEIPAMVPESLSDEVPEVTFTLKEILGFITINNLDLKLNQLQIRMMEQRKKINRAKLIPKFYLDGFYGQSGEAWVDRPLELAAMWTLMAKMSWTLWGNTLEVTQTTDRTDPRSIVDNSKRINSTAMDMKFGFFDDMTYFVDAKEGAVNHQQAAAEYNDVVTKNLIDLEKYFNAYEQSLRNARALRDEIALKKRKLDLLKKRNDLYEVPTVNLMEESWRFAETIASYGQAMYTNYASVTEMERMTLMSLR